MRKLGTAAAAAVLIWGVLALALGSVSLRIANGSSRVSPACLQSGAERSATLPGSGLQVSPAPGSGTANPAAQISFLGARAATLRALTVVGDRSGRHAGRLERYSQGDGASFVPERAFDAGELVKVRAAVGDGAQAQTVAFAFRVDTPYPTGPTRPFPNPPAARADTQSFHTMPGVQAPVLSVDVPDRDPSAGDILTTNGPGPGQYGPLIYTPRGQLVWFERLPTGEAAEDLTEQAYEGRRVLTWWRGRVLNLGFGQGEDVVMDSRYRTLATVHGGNGLRADLHDFQLAGGGVAYVTAYNPIRCDLRRVGGTHDGTIVDTAIQQIDMRTGLVRWEWHSLDHVGPAESEVETPKSPAPWDYFHLNSIDIQPGGDLFISGRSTWAGYLLERGSGRILWRLGGNRSSFRMGPGTRTAWQHDGRLLAGGEVTFFDNGANPPIHHQSRALRLRLDAKAHTARLVSATTHPGSPLLAASQGNVQSLAGGGTVVGYGSVPAVSQYGPDGKLVFDAHEPFEMSFYRAFRFPWSARPLSPPAVVANLDDTGEETIVYASWNGATGVARWRVLAGQSPRTLSPRAETGSAGFESSTTLPVRYAYVQVQALDGMGRTLAASPPSQVNSFAASLRADRRRRRGATAFAAAAGPSRARHHEGGDG
jgi:hypothetical protein